MGEGREGGREGQKESHQRAGRKVISSLIAGLAAQLARLTNSATDVHPEHESTPCHTCQAALLQQGQSGTLSQGVKYVSKQLSSAISTGNTKAQTFVATHQCY